VQEQWLARVQKLRRWSRNGQRAPHKPLLLLWMLGRLQAARPGPIAFTELEEPVRQLLRDFEPSRASHHHEFPFHHLTSDGLWVITTAAGADARPLGTAVGRLRSAGAVGQLEPAFEAALLADPTLLAASARALLDANFPAPLHEDLLARTGLALEPVEAAVAEAGRRRDPAFRTAVLVAYEYRCAMCGFGGWLGGEVIGLDAAHVRWWAIGGPDSIDNALALCTLHHRLFDPRRSRPGRRRHRHGVPAVRRPGAGRPGAGAVPGRRAPAAAAGRAPRRRRHPPGLAHRTGVPRASSPRRVVAATRRPMEAAEPHVDGPCLDRVAPCIRCHAASAAPRHRRWRAACSVGLPDAMTTGHVTRGTS
jgi:putative restriction endonuclease